MRTAVKNVLFTTANSIAMLSDEERAERLAPIGGHINELSSFARFSRGVGLEPWVLATYIGDAIIGMLLIALVTVKVRKYRRLFSSPTLND